MEIKVLKTEITLDWGTLIHILFGILAILLNESLVFTLIFLTKQLVDFVAGEDGAECSGDIVEYSLGMIIALIFKLVLTKLS